MSGCITVLSSETRRTVGSVDGMSRKYVHVLFQSCSVSYDQCSITFPDTPKTIRLTHPFLLHIHAYIAHSTADNPWVSYQFLITPTITTPTTSTQQTTYYPPVFMSFPRFANIAEQSMSKTAIPINVLDRLYTFKRSDHPFVNPMQPSGIPSRTTPLYWRHHK